MANWINKHILNRRQNEAVTLEYAERKRNNLELGKEKIKELLQSTNKLKQLTSDLDRTFTDFQRNHQNAEKELRMLKQEIIADLNDKARTRNSKRDIVARFVLLENGLTMERANFEIAITQKYQFSSELLQLEKKILEIRKITSFDPRYLTMNKKSAKKTRTH